MSPVEARSAVPARGLLAQGLVTNLLNPKAGAFFTAVFPQFVSAHGAAAVLQVVVLALIAAAASLTGQCAYAVAAYRVSQRIERRRFEKFVDSTVGVVLIGLGAKLALTQHP